MNLDLKFGREINPEFFVCEKNKFRFFKKNVSDSALISECDGIFCQLNFSNTENGFKYTVTVENKTDFDYSPETFGVNLGIDTYLETYPEWNEKFFPTHFRCEETHFWGYFMGPTGRIIGVFTKEPIASYSFDYNGKPSGWGHRINFAGLALLNAEPLPFHHPKGFTTLKKGEKQSVEIYFEYCDNLTEYKKIMTEKYSLPLFDSKKYTLSLGEEIKPCVITNEKYTLTVKDSKGNLLNDFILKEEGIYKAEVITESGKKASACYFCRKDLKWYMENARKEVVLKPPHATTHCESWYGFYTGFLAQKHYPDAEFDGIVQEMFEEIMPYVFDFNKCKPKLISERIQNVASIIGILTDRYESCPSKYGESLMKASKFADWLITRQHSDGGYYRENIHYTCVIYPAKSMLELSLAEAKLGETDEYFKDAAIRHYNSAKRAIDDLVLKLEDIGTEGEHTLEDGMISCSALQIAYFATLLPENEREKYIKAAEHMLAVHRCLEQELSPDCRIRGTTVRYWEAQYDVNLRRNFITSPHGWSGWLLYALYYLYILTGKEEYLTQFMNGMGACIQLLNLDGQLKWAFAVDPYAYCNQVLLPDESQPVHDAYKSVAAKENAYRGMFEEKVMGEEYINMISGWYRTCKSQKVTGGFYNCPLILAGKETIRVDRQGGCCDNDVHEIFKCLEETALKKAFVLESANGSLLSYSCKAEKQDGKLCVTLFEECEYLHINLKNILPVVVNGKIYKPEKSLKMIKL